MIFSGDSLSHHDGSFFSSKDADNDKNIVHCSQKYTGGGWWFHDGCHHSNPNGLYHQQAKSPRGFGINWYHWKKNYTYSLKSISMKIRRK